MAVPRFPDARCAGSPRRDGTAGTGDGHPRFDTAGGTVVDLEIGDRTAGDAIAYPATTFGLR